MQKSLNNLYSEFEEVISRHYGNAISQGYAVLKDKFWKICVTVDFNQNHARYYWRTPI